MFKSLLKYDINYFILRKVSFLLVLTELLVEEAYKNNHINGLKVFFRILFSNQLFWSDIFQVMVNLIIGLFFQKYFLFIC